MPYFNYHAKAKNLIKAGCLIEYKIFENYNGIAPAMVLFFTNHKPMPIREYKWPEYLLLIKELKKGNGVNEKFKR